MSSVEILAIARAGRWPIGLGMTAPGPAGRAPAAIAQLRGLLWDRRNGLLIESTADARTTDPQQHIAHWQMLTQLALGNRPGTPDAGPVTTTPPPTTLPPGAGPPARPAALPPANPPDNPDNPDNPNNPDDPDDPG
ncbi:hypothetical protein [Kitasatospora sp. NPDC094015]|uniref:hypothetical protein n=1 Tax=Kitasatospora sp. NPDC094015 TaxID=3155205 RepID=UPI00332AE9E0